MTTQRDFHKLVNMSPKAIRAWAKDDRAACASWKATRDRLPALAKLKAKPRSKWTPADYKFAKRVIAFNSRMIGMQKKHGCTTKIIISLRNWGHQPTACRVPVASSRTCPPLKKRWPKKRR